MPNLPISPCSLRPVKVCAIFQKRMCTMPEVTSSPSVRGEKATLKTSWAKALLRSVISSCFQFHTVSMKSGKAPTEATLSPRTLKQTAVYARSVPCRSTR